VRPSGRRAPRAIKMARHALALMEPVPCPIRAAWRRGTIWPRLLRLGGSEQAAGRVSDGLRHLAKARSMVGLPEKIGPADRETVVLYVDLREQLAQALLKRGIVPGGAGAPRGCGRRAGRLERAAVARRRIRAAVAGGRRGERTPIGA